MTTALLALTEGDPAGIGPELALKAWLLREREALSPFAVFGSLGRFKARAQFLKLEVPLVACSPAQACAVFPEALPVIETGHDAPSLPGQPDPATAAATIASIRQAVAAVQAGDCAAVVTNPIAKSVLYAAGFQHPGHTEFLAELAKAPGGDVPHPVMMIWSELLVVVPVTIHIPLKDVPGRLTTQLIVETGRIVARDLRQRFGLASPRLALAGLNPHAGEGGAMGHEDAGIITLAVAALQAEGIDATGPWPADTMFHARARQTYDVALGMYHDQVLIPAKTLAFDEGVNVTLGLPFIRTSPDHGTAFDIAAYGIARPDSLCAALRLAARLTSQPVAH